MKSILIFALGLASILITSCGPTPHIEADYGNPTAPGFNMENSDQEAMAIADEVMDAMGGREAWDTSRYIGWTFFGRRHHTWDKVQGRNRIDIPSDSLSMIIDLKRNTGSVKSRGEVVTNPDTVAMYVEQGRRMWINDSYWLVMPYKLKDSGVTLKYMGKDTTTLGARSDVLELTFADVGVTPDNKYLVYVDEASRLVTQWDYYSSYQDSVARFQSPWPNYKDYGDLLLSGGQIAGNKLTDITVSQTLGEDLFAEL